MGDSGERKWIRPDLPSKCTYQMNKTKESDSPHRHLKRCVQYSYITLYTLGPFTLCLFLISINNITIAGGGTRYSFYFSNPSYSKLLFGFFSKKKTHENEKNRSGSLQDLSHSQFENICIQAKIEMFISGSSKTIASVSSHFR